MAENATKKSGSSKFFLISCFAIFLTYKYNAKLSQYKIKTEFLTTIISPVNYLHNENNDTVELL